MEGRMIKETNNTSLLEDITAEVVNAPQDDQQTNIFGMFFFSVYSLHLLKLIHTCKEYENGVNENFSMFARTRSSVRFCLAPKIVSEVIDVNPKGMSVLISPLSYFSFCSIFNKLFCQLVVTN